VLAKLGMNQIELRGAEGKSFVDYSVEEAGKIKEFLWEKGVRVSVLGSPVGKIGIEDDFLPHMELFKHTVELSHLMETPYIRMFSFFIPNGKKPEEYKDAVFERLGKFVDYAGENDVVLLHENEKDIYGDTAPRCLELMKAFYGDHFKAVFDFANFVQVHQDTLEAYELLEPYIAHIHIKDAIWESGKVVPAGAGDGHVKEILGLLDKKGYEGFLSLEPHLGDFTGFLGLEKKEYKPGDMKGPEAFEIAHRALMGILQEI
jgi:sugar phosphate isomerase/epimerase